MWRVFPWIGAALAFVTLSSCDGDGPGRKLSMTSDGDALILIGWIDRGAPNRLAQTLDEWPDITKIVLRNVPGARHQGASRRVARMVMDAGLTTIVPAGGLVAGAGTEVFLAGTTRHVAFDGCVGVRSWSTGMFGVEEGRFVPRDDPEHAPYLAFYQTLDVDEEFYWFAIGAAAADRTHWMRALEINHFRLSARPVPDGLSSSEIDHLCAERSG